MDGREIGTVKWEKKMKKKWFWIFIVMVIVLVAGGYLVYDSIFPKAEPLKLLKVSETDDIYIYDSNENEIELSDSEIGS